jgi:uncharacterized protein (TIGR02588 family)
VTDDLATDDEVAGLEGVLTGDALERAIVAVSVVVIAAMLGYVAWQAVSTSETVDPVASVDGVEPTTDGDRLRVTVRLDNRRGTGLSSVGIAVQCGNETRSLTFEHVPAGSYRTGKVVCPAGTSPKAAVETWMEA